MPETVNDRLLHESVAHSINLSRYSTGAVRRMIALLNATDERLTAELARALAQVEPSSFAIGRLESLIGSARLVNAEAYRTVFGAIPDEMRILADYETTYQRELLAGLLPGDVTARFDLFRITPDQAYAAAISAPFQGGLLRDWAASAEANRLKAMQDAIRSGFVEGRTTGQIIQDIRGTKAKGYRDGRLEGSRRGLEAIVRTALSHTAATAREQVYEANDDIIKAVRWVATLDLRTSSPCRLRDGLRYSADKAHKPIGHKVPWLAGPGRLHFNCRSVSSPVTKSFRELGLDIDEIAPGTRASMDGQVPADLTYGEWLKKQSPARQDDVVGAERGKLMRNGGLPYDRLYSQRGDWLTLDELRARDGAAFRRAGLSPKGPARPEPEPPPKPAPKAPSLAQINAKHDKDMRALMIAEGNRAGVEFLVGYNEKTGEAYDVISDGLKNRVNFPPWLIEKLEDPANQAILHHNHPSSRSLSSDDLLMTVKFPGLKGVWAHGHNGSSYYAEAGQRIMQRQDYDAADGAVRNVMQALINRREMAIEDAQATSAHAVALLLEARGFITYKADLQKSSLTAFNRAKGIIEGILANG